MLGGDILKVNAIQVVLGGEVGDGLDKSCALPGIRNMVGEEAGARPASDRDQGFNTLYQTGCESRINGVKKILTLSWAAVTNFGRVGSSDSTRDKVLMSSVVNLDFDEA